MSGRHQHDFRIFKPGAKPPASTFVASNVANQDLDSTAATWIDQNALVDGQSRKNIRAQAARASAAARRATLARKEAKRRQQPGSGVLNFLSTTPTAGERPSSAEIARKVNQAVAITSSRTAPEDDRTDQAFFQRLIGIVTPLLERRPLSLEQPGEVSLAHSSIRAMMWDAMTSSTTLFQVAIFVAGTHSNTCGLPRSAFLHMGPGLLALRGASLDAIQAKVASAEAESVAPVSIALLAGWERRYGDQESYDVHMRAWKALPLPTRSLEENSVATLTDLALEMYRRSLDDRATVGTATNAAGSVKTVPVGFRTVMSTKWPEGRSQLAIVAQLACYDHNAKSEIARLRRLGLENMAWSPTHTRSYEPQPEYEDEIDPLELNALYHIRAANISICGLMLQRAMIAHEEDWPFDIESALWLHTSSCVHLRTEALLGTKYQNIALWARFSLCAIARDPSQDAFIAYILDRLEVTDWKSLRAMFEELIYHEMFNSSFPALFEQVTKPSSCGSKPNSDTSYETMSVAVVNSSVQGIAS